MKIFGIPVIIRKKLPCTCKQLPARPVSMDYNDRYLSMLKCPTHSKVPDTETKKYEKQSGPTKVRKQKSLVYMSAFAVMQAVGLGKDGGQTGIKALDTPQGWRAISTFPTREDARAYLLDVLDTVKREQKMGIRTKRNLDPKYSGGLDFCITEAYIVVSKKPLLARGWKLQKLSTPQPLDNRRKLTDNIKERGRGGSRTAPRATSRQVAKTLSSRRAIRSKGRNPQRHRNDHISKE